MRGAALIAAMLLALCCGAVTLARAQPASGRENPLAEAGNWDLERVELMDGRTYQGLIESEDQTWVHLIQIHRPPAQPMYLVIRPVERASIAKLVRLEPEPRAVLQGRIERFINRAQIEAGQMDAIRLGAVEIDGVLHHSYHGKWFSLECTTHQDTARWLIVRIEQMFTAYRQVLPPRVEPRQPLRLRIFGSLEQFNAYLEPRGLKIGNRAIFFPQENLVVAGSELARYGAELAAIRARHETLRRELKELRNGLPERLQRLTRQLQRQGTSPEQAKRLVSLEKRRVQEQIEKKLVDIEASNRKNDQALGQVARQMLTRFYHEAFHAYLENYVYPPSGYHVPLWLNEGLAVTFEGALLDAGSLRLDAPNRDALERLKADLAGGPSLSLSQVLGAGPPDFLVRPHASSASSHRHYDYAWGLVYYLTFQKRLLGSPALDAYVAGKSEALSPVARFETLVGTPLADFEKTWHDYVLKLP